MIENLTSLVLEENDLMTANVSVCRPAGWQHRHQMYTWQVQFTLETLQMIKYRSEPDNCWSVTRSGEKEKSKIVVNWFFVALKTPKKKVGAWLIRGSVPRPQRRSPLCVCQ
jgi:hypothetical protein